jgi:hypothetical protein
MPSERQTKNVARKQRNGFRVSFAPHCSPDYARLHPGYQHTRHSRAGGKPAKQKCFSLNVFEVKHFVSKALDSRLRGNDKSGCHPEQSEGSASRI